MTPAPRCSDQFWPGAETPTSTLIGPSFGKLSDMRLGRANSRPE